MAAGYRQQGVSLVEIAGAQDNAQRQRDEVYGGLSAEGYEAGAVTLRQPIGAHPRSSAGYRQRSFFEDFYNRVYLLPTLLDYKAVAARASRSFYIWNAWLRPTTLTQVVREATESTSITGPTAPLVYGPLELREYTAVADADGPPNFLANYRFIFNTGEVPQLQLLGERARRLPFQVNWAEPYSISLEYKTDIVASRSGREQRRATRQTPRKSVSYRTLAARENVRRFNRHMVTWQNRVIIMPEETTFVKTTHTALAGGSVLEVESTPHWLRVGTTVYVRSKDMEIVATVEQIVGTSVRLGEVFDTDLPAGAHVMVALYGRLGAELSSERETNTVFQTEIAFDVSPASEQERILPGPVLTLNGRPLFVMKPNWGRRPSLTYIHPREVVDFGVGRTEFFNPIDFTTRQTEYQFSGSAAKIEEFVEHFRRMRGSAGEFYYPTWEPDLVPTGPITTGTRAMEIAGSEVFDTFGGDTVYRGVMVVLKDGRRLFNTLQEDITFSDGLSILTMRENWTATAAPDEIEMVSWLLVHRFAGDKITVDWLTREVGRVQATFRTLEDLA